MTNSPETSPTLRVAVATLSAVAMLAIAGMIALAMAGKAIPDGLNSAASAALGALAALLTSGTVVIADRRDRREASSLEPTKRAPNTPDAYDTERSG